MRATSFLTGVLFGGLAAGSAVLLLAPSSGKELREDWRARGREIGSMVGQVVNDSVALKNDLGTASRRSVRAIQQGTKGIWLSVDEWRKSAEPNVDELREKIQALNDQMDRLEESLNKQPPLSE